MGGVSKLSIIAVVLVAGVAANGRAQVKLQGEAQAATTRWVPGAKNAGRFLSNGMEVRVLTAGEILVAVAIARDDNGNRLETMVENQSPEAIDVDPALFSLRSATPNGREFKYRDPDKLASRMEMWTAIGAAIAEGTTADATKETTVRTRSQGRTTYEGSADVYGSFGTARVDSRGTARTNSTSTTKITEADEEARARGRETAREAVANTSRRTAGLRGGALRANTLVPGERIFGAVYFEKDWRTREFVATVVVGSQRFEFPVTAR